MDLDYFAHISLSDLFSWMLPVTQYHKLLTEIF